MLVQVQGIAGKRAHVAVHSEVKVGIVPFDGVEELVYPDLGIKFFLDLAVERLYGRFTRFNLAPRPLPVILPRAIASLGGEYQVSFTDYGGDYFYAFHDAGPVGRAPAPDKPTGKRTAKIPTSQNKTRKNPCKFPVKISAPTGFGYFLAKKRIFLGTRTRVPNRVPKMAKIKLNDNQTAQKRN